jgi:hypothetical protein
MLLPLSGQSYIFTNILVECAASIFLHIEDGGMHSSESSLKVYATINEKLKDIAPSPSVCGSPGNL